MGFSFRKSADLACDLGAKLEIPENWAYLFLVGPGVPKYPDLDKSKYPSKHVLLTELEAQHNKVKQLLIDIKKYLK